MINANNSCGCWLLKPLSIEGQSYNELCYYTFWYNTVYVYTLIRIVRKTPVTKKDGLVGSSYSKKLLSYWNKEEVQENLQT